MKWYDTMKRLLVCTLPKRCLMPFGLDLTVMASVLCRARLEASIIERPELFGCERCGGLSAAALAHVFGSGATTRNEEPHLEETARCLEKSWDSLAAGTGANDSVGAAPTRDLADFSRFQQISDFS